MAKNEIGEAIGYVSGMIKHPAHNKLSETAVGYLKSMIALAEEYLKVEGWIEEKECPTHKKIYCDSRFCYDCAIALGFNEALHLCKLTAFMDKNEIETKRTGGEILFMDLCRRLIKRILEFNPDEHDIELNLAKIISKAQQKPMSGDIKSKDDIFIKHIQSHLQKGQEVVCKICGKSADAILAKWRKE